MIIDSTGGNKVTYGETKEYKTTIDIENLDFIATLLSSNLYSNPEASFIREIVSNGWDSQVEAGNTNTPLIVRMKRNNESYHTYNITIRDYGTGLSKEEFENLFCKIGSSTKRESNNYIGCFGLGHLSPLAVSKVCYINSYYNGIVRLYIMTKDGNSITTNLMSEMPTDEPNGLEITVKNVEGWKYNEPFSRLAFFPNVYVDGAYNECNNTKIKRYKHFTAASVVYNDKLLLGNVLYPIDDSIIPAELKVFYDAIVKSGIVFNFNIGELQVTPNRESIIYNSKTNALIINRIKEAKKEMEDIISPVVAKDYKNPYEYYNVVKSYFLYDFIENRIRSRDEYYKDDIPKFTIEMFDLDVTLDGKHLTNINPIYYLESYFPYLKGIIHKDVIYKDDRQWRARRSLNGKIKVLFVKDDFKLGVYVKPYLMQNYYDHVVMLKPELQDFITYFKQRHLRYGATMTVDEKHIITCCYNHLISRGVDLNLDNDANFIKFKEDTKAANKANKVPANTGKVILTVWRAGSRDNYYNRSEFKSYAEALKFIKSLKGGTLFKNLDETAIAPLASCLGYNTIAANKKVMDWLAKEKFTSRITENTIYNNNVLITLKAVQETGFKFNMPEGFINSLTPRLRDLAYNIKKMYLRNYYNVYYHLDKVELDEDLVKDLQDINNCYAIYNSFAVNVEDSSNKTLQEVLYYVIMKQKGYKINYDCYKKLKENKLLSLLCKKS